MDKDIMILGKGMEKRTRHDTVCHTPVLVLFRQYHSLVLILDPGGTSRIDKALENRFQSLSGFIVESLKRPHGQIDNVSMEVGEATIDCVAGFYGCKRGGQLVNSSSSDRVAQSRSATFLP